MTTHSRLSMHLRTLAAGAALLLAACGEQSDDETGVGPSGPTGRIRFVNAVAKDTAAARPLNVTVDGAVLAANLAYAGAAPSGAATPYFPAYAGTRALSVRRTADTTVSLFAGSFTVTGGQDMTLVLVRNGFGVAGAPELQSISDAGNTAPAAGKVKLRVLHMAPSAGGNVDVYITPSTVTNITNIPPQVAGLATRAASAYLDADAGSYTVRFTLSGSKTVLATANLASLAGGAVRSVFLLDAAAGGTPLTTLTLIDR